MNPTVSLAPIPGARLESSLRVTQGCQPSAVIGVLVATDIVALVTAVALSVLIKAFITGPVELAGYLQLWPAIPVFVAVYAALGLYSVIAIPTQDEIRKVSASSAVVFVLLAAITVSQRGGRSSVTWTLALAVLLTIFFIPFLRSYVRRAFGHSRWWGFPAVVFGSGSALQHTLTALTRHPGVGLVPVAVATEDPTAPDLYDGLPVIHDDHLPTALERKAAYAVVAMPGLTGLSMIETIERRCAHFTRVIWMPPLGGLFGFAVEPRNLAGQFGLEISQHIYARHRQFLKDVLDLTLAIAGMVVLAPVFGAIALGILIQMGRPVFYGHRRVGRDGEYFRAWKFRSMVNHSDAVLASYLAENPSARAEWELTRKLRKDPRVTWVGNLLRKTSLDELPQLWNVLCGEMSIVGPRPVVDDEVPRYGEHIKHYCRVKGGITGLWQVSGRNDTTYEERVALDVFYVRNWSVWLDLFIIARTITTVISRRGAC